MFVMYNLSDEQHTGASEGVRTPNSVEGRSSRRSACDFCREYKVRCSGSKSKCDRCAKHGKACTFTPASGRRNMRAQDFRGNGHSHRRSQDKFIIVEPGPNLFNTKENRQSPREQLRQLESGSTTSNNNSSSAVTTPSGILSGPSTRPSSPISTSVHAIQSRAPSLSPPREQQQTLNSRLSLEDLCPPTDVIPSCRESWNYEILADLGETRRSGICSDLAGSPSDVFPWAGDWSILLNSGNSAHTSRLPTPSLTATPTVVDHSGSRPSIPPAASEGILVGAGPTSAPCNCLQHLTLSVFDLNSWTANHHRADSADASHMLLGKFLSVHRDRMATFEHLCNTCLAQPDSAQLLIVNIEQLADLQEKQMNHLQEAETFPADTIVIGSFVVDHTLDRVVIARQLLAARKAKFIRVLESLRSRLVAAGMSDCYNRLDMILERLNKCRVGQSNGL